MRGYSYRPQREHGRAAGCGRRAALYPRGPGAGDGERCETRRHIHSGPCYLYLRLVERLDAALVDGTALVHGIASGVKSGGPRRANAPKHECDELYLCRHDGLTTNLDGGPPDEPCQGAGCAPIK